MGHKLSILPRQYDKTGWHQTKQFNVPEIQKIKVDGAGKGKSLNAIPSPFARLHLFETAFEMVFQDLINQSRLAGEAYSKIVSDCLDVFELIYNWDSHINEGKQLEMVTWKKEEEIYELQNSTNKRHKLLGQTLNAFFNGENAFEGFEQCLIIKYNGKVIAGSTPFTGFFTTPDDLGNLGLLKPLSQIAYFSRNIPFQERKQEVRRFIYDFFENNQLLKSTSSTSAVRDYLEWYKNQGEVSPTTSLELKSLVANGVPIKLFGQNLQTAKSIGTQFFERQIIRLNYRLNDECFVLPRISNDNREYDYLMPLTPSFFEEFDKAKVSQVVSVNEIEKGTVEVTINANGKLISKKYHEKPIHEQDGKIIDLQEDYQISFNLGIFPFLKVVDQPEGIDYNDFYRVMITMEDLNYRYSNKDFNLRFGKNNRLLESGSVYKINRVDRTIFEKDKSLVGSTYFGLSTFFDYIKIEFPPLVNGESISNIIVPKWKERRLGDKQIDFAIDLGTTSTFIAFTDDPNHQTEPKSFEFNEKELPVVLLNKPKEKRPEFRWVDCFEKTVNSLLPAIEIQKQEFLPSIIKRKEKYQFPIRTSLYEKRSISPNEKAVLQNANISFVYQTKDDVNLGLTNQEYVTNLKWNIKTNSNFESSIQIFIEELFLLIRTKILLNDGNPAKSRICWFSPLSFTSASKRAYTDLWNKHSKEILKYTGNNIYNLTESEAPFYYLFRNAAINNAKSVLTVDIGGGSTDLMLFNEKTPVLGTSVHFGANVIWGNGFSEFVSEKTNGIYLAIKNKITENLNGTELKRANEDYCSVDSYAGSDEIINFWIANNESTKVIDRLKNGDFRLTYLLHLSALIYHSLKLLKANNQYPPTCVIFSGNGSKYIDLIHDSKCIERIWGYFSKKIFGPEATSPQVILPVENRKEATCFGGLFVPLTRAEFRVENYLGFEKTGEKYLKYRDIELNKDNVIKNILTVFNEFIDWFFEMNDVRELNFRNEFGIDVKTNLVKKYIIEKAEENLNLGYIKRFVSIDKDDLVSDSMFYYPLVGLIYKISKLTDTDIQNMIEKTTLYLNGPDGEGEFLVSKASFEKKGDTIYVITFENDNPDIGLVTIIDDPTIQKRALSAYQGYIDPVCSYENFPEPGKLIRVIASGRVKRGAAKWIVTEKIRIEFV